MKQTTKHLSETKVELTITVSADELKDAELVALTKIARDIKVPGFRQGKVPASVAAKHVNPNDLAQHTLENALSKAVADAFLDAGVQALDRPEVEVKKFEPGSELEFVATSEILPKIKLGDYKKLAAKPEKVSVTKKDVDEIIDRIRAGYAEKKPADRKAKKGDEVNIDFVGKKEGVAFDGGTAEGYDIVLGSDSFIPGFEDGIVGHKAGDKFDLDLAFPEHYHVEDLKGAKVVFSVTLNEVKEVVEPELTDELAAKAGPFKTVKELEDDIKAEITKQKQSEADDKLKDALVSELVEKSDVPVPEILVQDQMRSIEQDMVQNLMQRGLTLDMYLAEKDFKDKDAWLESEVKEAAVNRVKAGLVLADLSKVLKVQATDAELLEKMNLLGQQYPSEDMRKQLATPEVQRDIANRLLTDKTIDELVALNAK
ncbi:trigger factor [Candidatus Mycosynbacter amalyticus]|uniref:Trigger factor n=1 Tax=Candidatus Mycosynbacter amalyticus TaxID=2665156 RepID=A0A857MNN6_9BACT|nr:trigger factor [Candidatus Mycosynbacter amalyticus]QHN42869.1 trigger factor [Candidatus Mycosynbacter amalyticus]